MPRGHRVQYPGARLHIFARGNARQTIFHDKSDYALFLDFLRTVKRQCQFQIYAYCLMPNHFHLLIEAGKIALSTVMKRLLTRYSWHYNFRRGRVGHVFQDRFQSIPCTTDSYFLELIRYIHLNPVRAQLTALPRDWPWSGHNDYINGTVNGLIDADFPLSLFHTDQRAALTMYSEFVSAGIGMGRQEKFYEHPSSPPTQAVRKEEAEIGSIAKTLEEIAADGEILSGVPIRAIKSPSHQRSTVCARRQFIRAASAEGYRCKDIADFIGCSSAAVSKVLC